MYIRVVKSLATWYVETHLTCRLPQKVFFLLSKFEECQFNITFNLIKNDRIVDSLHFEGVILLINFDNALDIQQPVTTTFVIVPKQYKDLTMPIEFYFEQPTTNQQIIQQILSTIQPYEYAPPSVTYNYQSAFIPYTAKIRALAYACREFGYSNDIYHGYVDFNKFRLTHWEYTKSLSPDFRIYLYPKKYEVSHGFIYNINYFERVDLKRRRSQSRSLIIQHANLENQQIFKKENQGIPYDAKSSPDKSLLKSLEEHQFFDITIVYDQKLFISDLLHPIIVQSSIPEFLPLKGLYMVTDFMLDVDFTQSTPVPYTTLRIVKRSEL